jgi:uncharacterized protein involved in exopolysaccharide biosynthesis
LPCAWETTDDEISLFDIWDALVRRRWLMLVVFVVVTGLATAFALSRPDVYRYQTSIQIGYTVIDSEEGTRREPIATPQATTAQLESSFIPNALRNVYDITREALATGEAKAPGVQVDSPDNSRIVHLTMEGPTSKEERYRQVLNTAAGVLIRDQAGIVETARLRLSDRRERLAREREGVQSELDRIRTRIDELAATDGESAAVALRIDRLQQEAASLRTRLLEIERERARAAATLEVLKETAGAFTGELTADSVARQREAAQRIAAATDGLRPTRLIAAPEASLTPVGSSGRLIIALGAVLGAMGAVFLAFLAEFVAAARRRNAASESGTGPEREGGNEAEHEAHRLE